MTGLVGTLLTLAPSKSELAQASGLCNSVGFANTGYDRVLVSSSPLNVFPGTAEENPTCQVTGTDLSLIQPLSWMPNCQFVMENSELQDCKLSFNFHFCLAMSNAFLRSICAPRKLARQLSSTRDMNHTVESADLIYDRAVCRYHSSPSTDHCLSCFGMFQTHHFRSRSRTNIICSLINSTMFTCGE